ncbi:hypothetical protein HY745_06880 [Candidatus Desantisbacteria bacterium]|nr:hypothetical protein [Candidatus Desantisbacteria bacterium]
MQNEQNEIQILQEIKSIAYFIGNTTNTDSIKLKLADFHYRAKNLQNIISVDPSKQPIIKELLNPSFTLNEEKYLAGSRISAIKKAKEVLRVINEKNIDLSNHGFLSLGGGDGTELFFEIENSKSNYGILMEYDFFSVNRFSNFQIPFYLRNSKRKIRTEVIECDLLDKIKFDIANKLIKARKLDGIVVAIHAVLHELSTRSQLMKGMGIKDKIETLFRRIYDLHSNILLIIREPGIPENWKERIIYILQLEMNIKTIFLKYLNK